MRPGQCCGRQGYGEALRGRTCQSIRRQQEPGRRPKHRLPGAPWAMLNLLPWVGLSFPIPPKSGDKTSCGEPHSTHVWRRLSAGPHSQGPSVWQLAPMAGGMALLQVSKQVCWCTAPCVTSEALASYCAFRALLSHSRTPPSLSSSSPTPPLPQEAQQARRRLPVCCPVREAQQVAEDAGSSLPSTSGSLLTHRVEKMVDLCQVGDLMMKALERGREAQCATHPHAT